MPNPALSTAYEVGVNVAAKTTQTDTKQGIEAMKDALRKIRLDQQHKSPGESIFDDASYNWLHNEWNQMAEETYLPLEKSKDKAVLPGETHAVELPGTSQKRKHLPSTVERQTKHQRHPFATEVSLKEVRAEEKHQPSSDTATIVRASHGQFRNRRVIFTSETWAEKVNLQPQQSKKPPVIPGETRAVKQPDTSREDMHFASLSKTKKRPGRKPKDIHRVYHRALPPGIQISRNSNYPPRIDKTKINAVHDAFTELCSPTYNPTKEETAVLWSMMSYQTSSSVQYTLVKGTTVRVIRALTIMLNEDLMWDLWVKLTDSQRLDFLNKVLNGYLRRWVGMYNIFEKGRPDIHNMATSSKSMTEFVLSNTGKSVKFAAPVHETSLNPQSVKLTSSELTTKDFLTDFGKGAPPSVDDTIGRSRDQAPSVRLTPQSVMLTSSELTTKDFLTDVGKGAPPSVDDTIGRSSDQAPSLRLTLEMPLFIQILPLHFGAYR